MISVLATMLPIIMLIGIGLAAARSGFASETQVDGVGAFVINLALPAVLLKALAGQDLTRTLDPGFLAVYVGGSLVAFASTLAVLRLGMNRPLTAASMGALGASASNSGFIGYPIATLALGVPVLTALPMAFIVETVLIVPLALMLAELGRGEAGAPASRIIGETAGRIVRMPLTLAILAGLLISVTGISLPKSASTVIDMLAAASAPCALFVVGGTIARLRRDDLAADIFVIMAGKLVIHPLAVATGFMLVPGVPRDIAAVGILLSSVSMITVYPILCGRFGLGKTGATALVATTSAALFTITIVLFLLT